MARTHGIDKRLMSRRYDVVRDFARPLEQEMPRAQGLGQEQDAEEFEKQSPSIKCPSEPKPQEAVGARAPADAPARATKPRKRSRS